MSAKKRKKSKDGERRSADTADTMVTYLECSDFKPPVSSFIPLIGPMLVSVRDEVSKYSFAGHERLPHPVGVIAAADDPDRFKFRVDCCWPAERSRVATLASLSGGDAVVPRDARVAKVMTYNIAADGRTSPGLPSFYFASDTYANDGDFWFPVVTPRAAARRVHRISGGGRVAEGFVYADPGTGGMSPYVSGVFLRATKTVWSVEIGAENGKSRLLFFTSEAGVCGFFDLRDGPADGRKAALRHFVNAYIRGPKATPVRCHFRGKEEFRWFGLDCRVNPPDAVRDRVLGGQSG